MHQFNCACCLQGLDRMFALVVRCFDPIPEVRLHSALREKNARSFYTKDLGGMLSVQQNQTTLFVLTPPLSEHSHAACFASHVDRTDFSVKKVLLANGLGSWWKC